MIPMLAKIPLLANPDVGLLTLFTGILLLYFECNRPGSILPGCLGALLVLLSLHSLAQLPLRPTALLLLATGTTLLLLELAIPARNLLAAAGIALNTYALATLVELFSPAHVHLLTAIFTSVGFGVSTLWLARIALQARRNKRTPALNRVDLNQSRRKR